MRTAARVPRPAPGRQSRTRRALALLLGVILLRAVAGPAAEHLLLTPIADTALLENFPTNNFGGQTWLNAGTTQNYTRNRGLLRFDVAGSLPSHARILSASMTLQVTRSPVDGDAPSNFDLHRMLRDWGEGNKSGTPPALGALATEGEATWTHRLALTASTWAEPGGGAGVDFAEASSADTFVYGDNFSPYTFDSNSNLVADVQLWHRDPAQNFGWMLKTRSELENFSARRFSSREDPFREPELAIGYELPGFQAIRVEGGEVALSLSLEPGESCAVECADAIAGTGTGRWSVLERIPVAVARTNVVIHDVVRGARRYYRLRFE